MADALFPSESLTSVRLKVRAERDVSYKAASLPGRAANPEASGGGDTPSVAGFQPARP